MKATSQDKISQLEEQIIALQRELDAARKSSTSIWCKLFDNLIDEGFDEDVAQKVAAIASETIIDWVKAQRAKVNRRISSMGTMPLYSDCLNELIVSSADPNSDYSDLLTKEEPAMEMGEMEPQMVRLPSPPPPAVPQDDPSLHMGPVKLLKVNVPRARATFPSPLPEPVAPLDSEEGNPVIYTEAMSAEDDALLDSVSTVS